MTAVQLHGLVAGAVARSDAAPAHRVTRCGAMSALVSDIADVTAFEALPPEQIADWVLVHHSILMAYCGERGILPMQVGAVFSSEAALCSEISGQEAAFVESLSALENLREYTLQLRIADAAPVVEAAALTGRDHLKVRHAARGRRETCLEDRRACARTILGEVDRTAQQVAPVGAPKPNRLLDCAMLVPLANVPRLHEIAQRQHEAAAALGLDLQIAGPWPPYSFDAGTFGTGALKHGC